MIEKYTDINLVKTDYDNFKNLKFFIEQHKKATKMIVEVEAFYESFIKSKLLTTKQLLNINYPIINVYVDKKDADEAPKITFDFRMQFYSFNNNGRKRKEEISNIRTEITKELDRLIVNEKLFDLNIIENRLNSLFGNKVIQYYDDYSTMNKFIIRNDKTLLYIPNNCKSSFDISSDETLLTITFKNTIRYKKSKTPGWLPYTVDTTTIRVVFDTTTNNYISDTINVRTHEEQDSQNRGY